MTACSMLHAAKMRPQSQLVDDMSPLMFSLQALLVRHETYIADSERERKAMTAHIESLEMEKADLEKQNATVVSENRDLLDQLEALNGSVAESDAHVVSLQATLQSTQQELQRLGQLASRTEQLERDLANFEREQVEWQTNLAAKDEGEKNAVRRWQKAERTLADLQDQIERIEKEAKDEQERHAEIVGRMERRHNVEKELGSAAGRLKGAAALKNGDEGNTVVSHFVKDILQDNANLQMGIVELREMLNTSNEEVESLRRQMQLHQSTEDDEVTPQPPTKRSDLREELTRANSSELHVHHHYHAPPSAPKTSRRPKKKRHGALTPGTFTPPSRSGTPRSSFSYHTPTPSATILQQTSASVPQAIPGNQRWSVQSNATYHSMLASSGPSSPRSTTNRTSSIFDRVFSDAGLDSSRPTTPDTEDPGSPMLGPSHVKRGSQSSFRTFSAPVVQRRGLSPHAPARPSLDAILSVEELPKMEQQPSAQEAIPEESELEWEEASSHEPAEEDSNIASPSSEGVQTPFALDETIYSRPPLRRAASHESLLSVSGMDIHTLKSRPSQLLAPYARTTGMTSHAAVSDTTAHAARPAAISRPSGTSGASLLSGMAAEKREPAKPGLGKKVGGWMFGKWGAAPSSSSNNDASTAATQVTAALKAHSTGGPSGTQPAASGTRASATAQVTTALEATRASSASGSQPPSTPITATKPRPSIQHTRPGSVSSAEYGSLDAHSSSSSPRKPRFRSAGINQAGPILGFAPEIRVSHPPVMVKEVDEEALRGALE